MTPEEASVYLNSLVTVVREDIVRAKSWLLAAKGTNSSGMAKHWLAEQSLAEPAEVNTDSPDCSEELRRIARAYSVHLAFFHAVWELMNAGTFVPNGPTGVWSFDLRSSNLRWGGAIDTNNLSCPYPTTIARLPFASIKPTDPDVFLKGINCLALNSGILEAIEQALICFNRGLYMPATVMLAAAAEATWTECGMAVATKLGNKKLEKIINDEGFGKIVSEIRKALEQATAGQLLKDAGQSKPKVVDAELWTTTLRDRRNALHWGKAKSFIADHSETGTLLMAAPQHLGTLEAIRAAS